jgi:hypothetical protein
MNVSTVRLTVAHVSEVSALASTEKARSAYEAAKDRQQPYL